MHYQESRIAPESPSSGRLNNSSDRANASVVHTASHKLSTNAIQDGLLHFIASLTRPQPFRRDPRKLTLSAAASGRQCTNGIHWRWRWSSSGVPASVRGFAMQIMARRSMTTKGGRGTSSACRVHARTRIRRVHRRVLGCGVRSLAPHCAAPAAVTCIIRQLLIIPPPKRRIAYSETKRRSRRWPFFSFGRLEWLRCMHGRCGVENFCRWAPRLVERGTSFWWLWRKPARISHV